MVGSENGRRELDVWNEYGEKHQYHWLGRRYEGGRVRPLSHGITARKKTRVTEKWWAKEKAARAFGKARNLIAIPEKQRGKRGGRTQQQSS